MSLESRLTMFQQPGILSVADQLSGDFPMTAVNSPPTPFPFVVDGSLVSDIPELAQSVVIASDTQVEKTRLANDEEAEDFQLSCDALNYWRALLRLQEESPDMDVDSASAHLRDLICQERGYDIEELDLALEATSRRARSPLGLDPLKLAFTRATQRPIRLLDQELASSEVATTIAGVARQLQIDRGADAVILLPVDQIRSLIQRRKIVVSGALLKLVDRGVLRYVNERYHTRRAREYRFVGVYGTDYVFEDEHHDDR